MLKTTLQNRIIILMVTSSLLLIGAFSFIQLNNQQENLVRFNAYRANLSGPIVKKNLEAILKQKTPEELPDYLKISLKLMAETMGVLEASVFDKDGLIIASTKEHDAGTYVSASELQIWQALENLYSEDRISLPEVGKANRALTLYVPLKIKPLDPITHTAKLNFSLGNIQEAFTEVYGAIIIAAIAIILANILLGVILSKTIVGPIKVLNEVTKLISRGDLSVRTKISTGDELQDLGSTFNYMTEELIKIKEQAENANPLTKLPGNIVIREQIENRIKAGRKFAVIYCDLDKFKSFNDKYGIARGDDAIKLTAEILKKAVKEKGNPGDFIGHEGGDDFLLLTTFDKSQAIADFIIKEFHDGIGMLYDKDDLARGFIISKNRDGSTAKFTIMTISLAGVSNEYRAINNYAEVTNIAAEIKEKVKTEESSAYLMDQRKA